MFIFFRFIFRIVKPGPKKIKLEKARQHLITCLVPTSHTVSKLTKGWHWSHSLFNSVKNVGELKGIFWHPWIHFRSGPI